MIPTKTLIPQRRDFLLHRSRLVNRLHRHVDRALTLVAAPAGYGKTSLLIDFANDAPFPICWLSLDSSDRDLRTFTEYLIACLCRRFPEFGELTHKALLTNPDISHNPSVLAGVIVQDIFRHVPEFFALVLDDYHSVDDTREINLLIEALLKYRPEHLHLIIASRIVPAQLPVVLLTAREQITFIGQDSLAFTDTEVRTLMARMHSIDLTIEQAQELVTESEGWITGILLSTAVIWRGMRVMLAQARSQQGPVFSYLAEQVFQEQPRALRDFMLVSSTLKEMNGLVCNEALGLAGANATLQELERRGVFLTTLADEESGVWYRYHHLFSDFLQRTLEAQDLARYRQLHHQAAEWFEGKQQWARAVSHRLTAGDPYAAARTMERGVKSLFLGRRMATIEAWYEALPVSLRPEFPRLLLFVARALSNLGRTDEALPLLFQAETTFNERCDIERSLFAALKRAEIWYTWGQLADALKLAQDVLDKATRYPLLEAEAHRLAGLASLDLGQPENSVGFLRSSLGLFRDCGSMHETAMAYLDLSFALSRTGQLSEAWVCQDKAIERFRQDDPSGLLATTLNNVACERHFLSGEYGPALLLLTEALEVAEVAGSVRGKALAVLSIADLYRDLGALDHALALYGQAEDDARKLGDAAYVDFALTGAAQTLLQSGNVVEALGLATQARDHARQRNDVYQLGLCCLTLGAAYLDGGQSESALIQIEQGRGLLEQCGARRDLTRAYVLLARARKTAGDNENALVALSAAIEIGIETQTSHYLVVEGQRAFDLLRQMLQRNPDDRRLASIMDRIRDLPDTARRVIGGLAPRALPHPPTLRFHAFGPGGFEKDGEPIAPSVWRSALARYVTFFLLVHSPRSRDHITTVFWPELSRDKAGAAFHWVKHQIHHALSRPLIVYDEEFYRIEWEPDYWFDLAAFESLLDGQDGRQARLEEAVALYRGDFLDGYDAEWCQPIRVRQRMRFIDALIELGEIYTVQGEYDRAFATLSRALALDDLQESASRALMRLYACDGRRTAALQHYRRLSQLLEQELGVSPEPETQALFQTIQHTTDLNGPSF